jgi:hypothetical protein
MRPEQSEQSKAAKKAFPFRANSFTFATDPRKTPVIPFSRTIVTPLVRCPLSKVNGMAVI